MDKPKHSNMNIELLRIIAMLLVVACHATIHLGWGLLDKPGLRFGIANTVVQFGQVGVCIFFMISGYFLARKQFNIRRIASSWLQMFIYSVLILVVTIVGRRFGLLARATQDCFADSQAITTTLEKELLPFYYNSYWFMGTYILLLCLIPFLNAVIEHCSRRSVFDLLAGAMVLSVTTRLFMSTVVGFSQLMLAVCCYLIGAYARVYPDSYQKVSQGKRVLIAVICTVIMIAFNTVALSGAPIATYLGWDQYGIYHDGVVPCFVLIAYALLTACLHITDRQSQQSASGQPAFWERHKGFAHLVALGGSATFGCYLLHENYLGWRIFWTVVNAHVAAPTGVVATMVTFLVLILALYIALLLAAALIDLCLTKPLRRLMLRTRIGRI